MMFWEILLAKRCFSPREAYSPTILPLSQSLGVMKRKLKDESDMYPPLKQESEDDMRDVGEYKVIYA